MLFVLVVKCFKEKTIEISLKEEQANGTLVVDLRKENLLLKTNCDGCGIKFVGRCSLLYLDENDSFIIRSLKIDREEICNSNEEKCLIKCDLLIEEENEIELIKLKIEIIDINDHRPSFLKKKLIFNISKENENFKIELEKAEDKDLNFNHSYRLNWKEEKDEFPFKLINKKENDFLELFILKEKLKKKNYEMELTVSDEDEEKDLCLIEINLTENELNSIEFEFDLYEFIISELNQTFIGQVQIKDENRLLKEEEEVNYRLIFSNDFDSNLFLIDRSNGKMFLKNFNEIEENFVYRFYVEGSFSSSSISSLTTVEIFVNLTSKEIRSNENDFIEILIPKSFQKNSQIILEENSIVPLTILQLFTSSSSSLLIFNSSIDKNYFSLKQLNEHSYEFLLLQSIDYEFIQEIHLIFIQSFLSKSLFINIQNLNDCSPYLLQSNFSFSIQENLLLIPFHLYTFQGFDQDSSSFTFFSKNLDEKFFFLNSTDGQLIILQSFDREFISHFSFSICISDQIHQTCSTVDLIVQDQNDNICSFNSSSLSIHINENLPSNTFLLQFQATDLDLNQYGTLFYSFNSSTSYLTINSSSAAIHTTTTFFDFESIQSYSIIITACDNILSSPSFCCSFQLHLNIIDLDDHRPFLIYPNLLPLQQIFIIDYTNQTMPQIKAQDNDLSQQHRQIFFNIIGGSLFSSLNIHNSTGQLSLHHHSHSHFPLFGSLILSISNQTIVHFNILIHQNQSQLIHYLRSFQQHEHRSLFSSYFLYLISLPVLLAFIISFIICTYLCKHRCHSIDQTLINTPSTTTLSARSISTSNNKKLYETYYSFGDSFISPQIIHL